MTTKTITSKKVTRTSEDRPGDGYEEFAQMVANKLSQAAAGQALFVTNADPDALWSAYLDNITAKGRQHYNCSACRHFIKRFGGLVVIDAAGNKHSALWPDNSPKFFSKSVEAMLKLVGKAQVTGVFLSKETYLGQPVTGDWNHLAVKSLSVWNSRTQSASQRSAELGQDFIGLTSALLEFKPDVVNQALNLLKSESLYRSERVLGVAEWLKKIQDRLAESKAFRSQEKHRNITWLSVATAPTGFCHVKSSMIGTLLDDIAAGMDFAAVSQRFAAKMNPTNYQRAQVAPSQGAIQQAEKLFNELGLAPALKRRYAALEEIPNEGMIWTPSAKTEKRSKASEGVFSHLQAKEATAPNGHDVVPAVTVTWEKFQKTVLPTAREISVRVPPSADRFMALVTAEEPTAPPILQWDSADTRNPFSWYYASGIDAEMRRRLVSAGGRFENVDIRCSLMWNNRNDLDLHCITPRGEHIYYGDKRAGCGGWLDVDMNVRGETETPVENIRWDRGRTPNGRYQFFVNLYRMHVRNTLHTPFMVEVEIDRRVFTLVGETHYENPQNIRNQMVRVAEFQYEIGHGVSMIADSDIRTAATSPNAWGVAPGSYVPVTAIVRSPNLWSERPMEHHGKHAFFLLQDCRDTQQGVGRGFFTEMLLGDLRPVRSVLEAYNATAIISGSQEATACGIGISNESTGDLILRVTNTSGATALYKLDRWD